MKIQTRFISFVVILHVVALVLSYFVLKENVVLFLIAEVFIIISVAIAFQLYSDLIKPLKLLSQGTEAIKDADFNVKFVQTGKTEMDQLIDVYNHMMDSLREERLKQEEQHLFLEKVVQNSPVGILILDFDEQIQQINPKACQLLDLKESAIAGLLAHNELDPHSILRQIQILETGTSKTISLSPLKTIRIQKSNFIDRGFPRQFVMIEELTEELLAAEKQAYGKIIRMMAHEVNNTIGPVNSIMQSALKLQQESDLKEAFQVAIDRNQNLNHFMRNFADLVRLPEPTKNPFDLHKLVRSVAKLMEQKGIESNIHFEFGLDESPFMISADEHQMEQALINIVKNAMEAIGQQGTITFKTNAIARSLTIADSGSGISETDAALLFSPFFSTKKDGQGIGLTLIREILTGHGFDFSLRTTGPNQTVFQIHLK